MLTLTKVHGVKTERSKEKIRIRNMLGLNLRRDIGNFEIFSVVFLSPAVNTLKISRNDHAHLCPRLLKFITMQSLQNRHPIYWLRYWQPNKTNLTRHQGELGNSTTVIP
jgi:hypothetical protein